MKKNDQDIDANIWINQDMIENLGCRVGDVVIVKKFQNIQDANRVHFLPFKDSIDSLGLI